MTSRYRFQAGDRVITIAALPGVPQGTTGTVTRVYHVLFDVCDVQFDGHEAAQMVVTSALMRVQGVGR